MTDRTRQGSRPVRTELARHRGSLWRLAAWAPLEALPAVLSGVLVARAVDHGFLASRFAVGCGYLLLLGAVHAAAALAVRQSYTAVATIVDSLRDVLLRRVVDTTLCRAETGTARPDQEAIARMTRQVETVRDVTAGLLLIIRRVVITMVATIAGLLALAPVLLALVATPLVLSMVLFGALTIVLARRQRNVILTEERVAGSAGPVLEGLRDVVAFGAERNMTELVGRHIDEHFLAAHALAKAGSLRVLVISLGAHVPVLLVLLAAPWLVHHGLSVGTIVGAITYLSMSLEPALRVLVQTIATSALRLQVSLRRLGETSTPPANRTGMRGLTPRSHHIELDHVTFAYSVRAEPVVSEFSLAIPEGDHLAIVGPSGAGKSTLANLIAGLATPRTGEIRIGDVPPGARSPHGIVALIPQEAYVFSATLRENLTYLRHDASDGDLDQAVDNLGLRFLVTRVGGYQARLRPATLSAGERQLIALARTYLADASIVILDEATCHLDPILEARAEEAFAARAGTLVVIAHRLSSARRANRILLVNGDRSAVGTHDELLIRSHTYRELVADQPAVR